MIRIPLFNSGVPASATSWWRQSQPNAAEISAQLAVTNQLNGEVVGPDETAYSSVTPPCGMNSWVSVVIPG